MGKNYFAVFGLGAFGTYLALELERCGNHVTVVDLDRDLVNDIRDKVSEAVVGDISNEEVIREMNVRKFTAVILAMSSHFEAQLLALTLLKQEGVRKVYAKASSAIQQQILYRLGADAIIQPEHDAAERLSRRLTLDNISEFVEFKGSAIAEVSVPSSLVGKSLRQLDLRNRYNINVLLLQKSGGGPENILNPDTELEEGDMLTVFGSKQAILEIFHLQK